MVGKIFSLIIPLLFINFYSFAQQVEPNRIECIIEWEEDQNDIHFPPSTKYFPWKFENIEYTGEVNRLPVYTLRIPISNLGKITTTLENIQNKKLDTDIEQWGSLFSSEFTINSRVSRQNDKSYAIIDIIPVKNTGKALLGLSSFTLNLVLSPDPELQDRNGEYALISELDEGHIYKFPISTEGLYRLDHAFFTQQNIDPQNIDPSAVQLYGNGGGNLPESLSADRIDDLHENPLAFYGNSNDQFEEGEYFIFYAEDASKWNFNLSELRYSIDRNVYDTRNYYFLKLNGGNGKRINLSESFENPTYTSNQTDVCQIHELEKNNLLALYDHTEGTGQTWYGENFSGQKEQNFITSFDFSEMLENESIQVFARLAARNSTSSQFQLEVGNQNYYKSINGVNIGSPEVQYAINGTIKEEFIANEKIDKVIVKTNAYQAWLDKIEICFRSELKFQENEFVFSDRYSIDHAISAFEFVNANDQMEIWDISIAVEAQKMNIKKNNSGKYEIVYPSQQLKKFVAFDPANITRYPGDFQQLPNQNLHGIFDAEMLIVTHDLFEEAAEELAVHRQNFNGLNVEVVNAEQIYNEFSSGRQDPTAIRNFAKMIYDRNENFRFLLLIGDGSFDYRALINKNNNDNFIPVYETKQSLNPISGYVSDDYFALLSDNEGEYLDGDLDIAIGRLPVRSLDQAQILVNKIIEYETSPSNNGDWQNRIALIADDEDYSRHLDQTEYIGEYITENYPDFNVDKIYLDAFQQEVNAGGHRYPDVNKSINDNIFKGVLAMTYIGHGGPSGFAQERILKLEDIYSWNNEKKLPLLITATCSFAGFDDPNISTAGEATILKESGGVIGLFSTVRLVYSGENSKLMNAVFWEIFKKYDGKYLKLGEILKYAKNNISNKDNKRKFFLFGDPAMQLAIPTYDVYTTHINDLPVTDSIFQDTLHALSKVKISGFVGDESGDIRTDFNGIVYPTVYDKSQIIETLGNDPKSSFREFEVQKQILFKGSATVTNGEFSFEFIIPKDIDYSFGEGKISYYYDNGDNIDGSGEFQKFIVGGTGDEDIQDEDGPEISLFMNHESFVSGQTTNNKPVLLAFLEDESGINVSGTSIGHDLNAVLDEDIQQQYILNEFFESSTDNYKSGRIIFPLDRLDEGLHSIQVEAWDIINNKGEAEIEFIVAEEADQVLSNIFAYPNPLDSETRIHFEHTLPDTQLDVKVSIFDISGKLVKVLEGIAFTDGYKVNSIKWDGSNQLGLKISNGIYYFNVEVVSSILGVSLESEFEKIVVIK